jgi:hypothetical protein
MQRGDHMKSKQSREKIKSVVLISLTAAFLICSISACATMPTQEQIANADYGPYPDNYQEIIKTYMENLLFDPYSAVYSNWQGPAQGYSGGRLIQTAYGYRVCVDINAKNRMGGYVGKKRQYFLINNGRVVQDLGEFGAQQLCKF